MLAIADGFRGQVRSFVAFTGIVTAFRRPCVHCVPCSLIMESARHGHSSAQRAGYLQQIQIFGELVDQVDRVIEQIDADGVYDTREAYDVAAQRQATLVVPPRENAVTWHADRPRAQTLAAIQEKGWAPRKKTRSTTIAASPKTPCTASSNSSGREWSHALSTPR
jgi:hypothetical protein